MEGVSENRQNVKVGKALKGRVEKKKKKKKPVLPRNVVSSITSCNHDQIVAIDCEMVGVAPSLKSALARCSIVNYHGDIVWDHYVLPSQPIMDYRTKWSGIRHYHMTGAVPEEDALPIIKQKLKGKIVVGHDLKHDFSVLHYAHPPSLVRDTSCYVPLRTLAHLPLEHPPGLKKLALNLLDRSIQTGSHDSVEDAQTCLDLYKVIEGQWENEMGDTLFLTDKYWPKSLQ